VVTSIEALAKPDSTPEQLQDARDLLERFIQVDIFGPIINETAVILRRKALDFPDAIIAATAIMLNATVLSNDPHLRDFIRKSGLIPRSSAPVQMPQRLQ
jgi:predicted nucleic acid-binding protein